MFTTVPEQFPSDSLDMMYAAATRLLSLSLTMAYLSFWASLSYNTDPMLALQRCTKQGSMPPEILSEAQRHAERLVRIAPDNPASHELKSYVLMHDVETDLQEACR